MRAYCGGSWRCQEDTEEEREVGGVEEKNLLFSKLKINSKRSAVPTQLVSVKKPIKLEKKHQVSSKREVYIYIYIL